MFSIERNAPMATMQSEKYAHQITSNLSEATRQSDYAAATKAFNLGGTQVAFDSAVKVADVAHLKRVIVSCQSVGVDAGVYREALWRLTGSFS